MRGPSDLTNKKQFKNKKEITSYEYKILDQASRQVRPTVSQTQKYVAWGLQQKIEQIVGSLPHSVRWIGNADTAYLQAYAYIILIGSGHSSENFLEFKQMIYNISRKYLSITEQKLLVEFLCLIEYAQDRYSFLSKYPQIQTVFIKILQKLEEEHKTFKKSDYDPTTLNHLAKGNPQSKHSSNKLTKKKKLHQPEEETKRSGTSLSDELQLQSENELEQIYRSFNSYFKFISTLGSNEYCCTLQLFNLQKIYVIVEKNCYFVVELKQDQPIKQEHFTFGEDKVNQAISQLQQIMNNQANQIKKTAQSKEKIQFDQDQFQQIFNFQRKVLESSVRYVERGQQIKTLADSSKQRKKGTSKFGTAIQKKDKPKGVEQQNQEKRFQNDHSFIDDLLIGHNEVWNSIEYTRKANKQKEPAKTARIQESMKGIMTIKEELKKVRSKIQDKIKKIDQQSSQKHGLTKTIMKDNKSSLKHIFKTVRKEKRSNSHSVYVPVPYLLNNCISITDRSQNYKPKQDNNFAKQERERVNSLLVNSPSSSNVEQVEQIDEERDIINNLSPINNDGNNYPQMKHSPTNFNLSVNVNINENTSRQPKLLSQHSSYPLAPLTQDQSISRYPSQFFNRPQFSGKIYPIKSIKYPQFPKTPKAYDNNPQGSNSFSKLKKITYTSNK